MTSTGTTWDDFRTADPEFADTVRQRFEKYRHHVLATLRRDGSPRVTGLEVIFRDGGLWFGMMPGSLKALDLRRDPRFALHANPGEGTTMDGGDVKISGRAVELTDPAELTRFAEAIGHPEPFHVFRVEPSDVVRTSVEGDELVVRSWHPGTGTVVRRRRG
ncbi:pyridoxamine 5'-phosphate oxidase family protein [Streptomyces sp. CAU 1734]|uniref:pyridoxamine 5'-phosphate oxidase family protein n=1 Tax=Streptomyces sp. CAU 1734 TaxID=3140360 RepID=UPI00326078BF